MKFLHAADIHLDSPLLGLSTRADLPAEVIRHCTRRAFVAMIDLAIEEDVAFVVIAGDLYDGDWKDFSTGLFFAEQMRRLARPCFLLRGNHDADSVITARLTPPGNVFTFSARGCQTFERPDLGVALHGHSFPHRAIPEDLSRGYNPPCPGLLNIAVLHSSAEDPGEHATYAPCNVAALALAGHDYWALGHIHQRRVLHERPWVVFPGNLQGRHVNEAGPKGCTIVTVEDRRVVAVEHRSVDVLRWAALQVDATGLDVASLTGRIAAAAEQAVAAAEGRPVLARLTLTGETDLHLALMVDEERLAAEASTAVGGLWVERVAVRTRLRSDAVAESHAALREAYDAGLDDAAIVAGLLEDLAVLRSKLPHAAREQVALPLDMAGLRALAEDAWAVAARALASGERA